MDEKNLPWRRKTQRFVVRVDSEILIFEEKIPCIIKDLSERGAKLEFRKSLNCPPLLKVKLKVPYKEKREGEVKFKFVTAQICWKDKEGKSVGIKFLERDPFLYRQLDFYLQDFRNQPN